MSWTLEDSNPPQGCWGRQEEEIGQVERREEWVGTGEERRGVSETEVFPSSIKCVEHC